MFTLLNGLSERQNDCIHLAALGFSSSQIAEKLFIGKRTVDTHLSSAYKKLGIRKRSELPIFFTRVGVWKA